MIHHFCIITQGMVSYFIIIGFITILVFVKFWMFTNFANGVCYLLMLYHNETVIIRFKMIYVLKKYNTLSNCLKFYGNYLEN